MGKANVVVVGGGGFIGSRLVRTLGESGHTVFSLDSGSANAVKIPGVRSRRIDVTDRSKTIKLLQSIKKQAQGSVKLVHLASISNVSGCEEKPAIAWMTNVAGFTNVLEAAASAGMRDVLLPSSGLVYDCSQQMPVSEDAKLLPQGVYRSSKLAGEALLRAWCASGKTSGCVFRLSQVYGPGLKADTVVHDILRQLPEISGKNSNKIVLRDPSAVRDFVYIDDVIAALCCWITAKSRPGFSIFNLSSGRGVPVKRLAETMCEIAQHRARVVREKGARAKRESKLILRNQKLKKWYSWSPSTSLKKGLGCTYRSMIEELRK